MKTLRILLLLCALPVFAQDNCSTANMAETGISTSGCMPGGSPPYNPGYIAPITETWTYQDTCTNTNNNTQYYSNKSTVTGNGQCQSRGYYRGILYWTYCEPSNEAEVTLATGPSDYNRMYNRAYDNYFSGSCVYTGIWRQDFQQCAGVECQTQGGGGGGGSGCCSDPGICTQDPSASGQCDTSTCQCIPNNVSPIIVDTTGRGFHLTSAEAGVRFDFFGNGRMLQLSWTDANSGNGFLALDRNHNGKIDNAKELFGNITEQPPSSNPNGYLALAEFDKPENGGNGDGIIDYHDAVYRDLLIWIDANHDGISQPEELHHLADMGVYSIGLTYKEEPRVDEFGNRFRYRGVLNPNPLDGTSKDGRYTYDVFLVPKLGTASSSAKTKCPPRAKLPLITGASDPFLKEELSLK